MVSLSRYLAEQGHAITVFALERKSLEEEVGADCLTTPDPPNVEIVRYSVPNGAHLHYVKRDRLHLKYFRKQIDQLLSYRHFDILLVSCGPFYPLRYMKEIKKKYAIPYIVDYRDLDVLNAAPETPSLLVKLKRRIVAIHKFIVENQCAQNAAHIVVVCPGDGEKIRKSFHIPASKITTIFNGYDETVLPEKKAVSTRPFGDSVHIGYFGKFMYCSPERGAWLLEAINSLRSQGIDVALHHIGTPNPLIANYIEKNELDPKIYVGYGDMNYQKGMEMLENMDILAMEDVHPTGLGTKIFDYIYLNRPVIAILPRGIYLAEFIQRFENCYACDSVQDIYNAIINIRNNKISVLSSNYQPHDYSRQLQNQRFTELLAEVINSANAG